MTNCVGKVLTRLARKCQIAGTNALQKYNLTAAEEPFLMATLNHEGFSQEELTLLVGVDKAATARAVRSLEEKGYLRRVQDPRDKRQNRVYPTEKAKKTGPLVKQELASINLALTQGLSREENDQLYALLKRIDADFKP